MALLIGVAVIFMGVFLGWYNNRVIPVNPVATAHYNLEPNNPLSFMSNWDGPNYITIATHGYFQVGYTNFFPLYPALIRLAHFIFGSLLDSALAISWASFIGAIFFYLKLVKKFFKIEDNLEASKALPFFVLFPTAIFMLASYTEALFACLALGCLYFAFSKRYLIAAILASLATATHVTGIFIVVLLALILLTDKLPKLKLLALTAIATTGIVAYAVYLWIRYDNPIAFITTQKSHGWIGSGYSGFFNSINTIDAALLLVLAITAIYWWRRYKAFSLYTGLFILLPFIGRQFGGFSRYCLMAFPIGLMLFDYSRRHKTAYNAFIILTTIGWVYYMMQYAGGYVGG